MRRSSFAFQQCWSLIFFMCRALRIVSASGVIHFVNYCDSGSPLLIIGSEAIREELDTHESVYSHGISRISFEGPTSDSLLQECALVDLTASSVSVAGHRTCSLPSLSLVLSCSDSTQQSIHCVSGLCQATSVACDATASDFELTVTFCPSAEEAFFVSQRAPLRLAPRASDTALFFARNIPPEKFLPIVLGASFGGIALLLVMILVCLCMSRRKEDDLPPPERKLRTLQLQPSFDSENSMADFQFSKDPVAHPSPLKAKRVGRQFLFDIQNNAKLFPSMLTQPMSVFED